MRFVDGHCEEGVGAEFIEAERKAVGETTGDDVDAFAVGGKHVQAIADIGGIADAQSSGELRGERCERVAGREGDGEFGAVEAVVGEGHAVTREILGAEAGNVFEELELVNDAADGVGIGGPLEGFGEPPRVAATGEGERAAWGGAGDFQGADVGGFGAEHAAAGVAGARFRQPQALEFEDKKEQRDVQEDEDERDFGAHTKSLSRKFKFKDRAARVAGVGFFCDLNCLLQRARGAPQRRLAQ